MGRRASPMTACPVPTRHWLSYGDAEGFGTTCLTGSMPKGNILVAVYLTYEKV